jgi:transposase
LQQHQDAVIRVAEVPGFGVDSAHQLIAEIGVDPEAFPSAAQFASRAGFCSGSYVSAEKNHSSRSAKGNRFVRRILTQAAHAAAKKKAADSSPYSAGSCRGSTSRAPFGLSLTAWPV